MTIILAKTEQTVYKYMKNTVYMQYSQSDCFFFPTLYLPALP